MKLIMSKHNISARNGRSSPASDVKASGRLNQSLKLVYLVVGIICLMLGFIGLIIPIIPGVLFLMAALYLLSRGSRRIKKFSEGQPHMRRMHRRMAKFGEVKLADRCRLAGWMAMDAAVKSAYLVKTGTVKAVRVLKKRVSAYS